MESDTIRILHLADTHLGYSAYRKVDENGINQREKDVYEAFSRIIDYVITSRPDLVIHAGDLFDSVRPNNRAIGIALDQLSRLSKEEIPVIVISGNHETPKLRETGHVFKLLEHLDCIFPIYKDKKEIVKLNIKGYKLKIHAVPHCRSKEDFLNALRDVNPDDGSDYNILVTHGAVQSIQEFRTNEFNEYLIPIETLRKNFDYAALGHYHKYAKVASSIVYPGSIEKFSFAESRDIKGIVEILLSDEKKVNFVPFPTREMVDVDPIDCKDLSPDDVIGMIEKSLSGKALKDSIVRINLCNIDSSTYRALDQQRLKNLFKETLHFEIRHSSKELNVTHPLARDVAVKDLISEYRDFLERSNCKDKKKFFELGKKYLEEVDREE